MTEDEAQAVFDATVERFSEDMATEGLSLANPEAPKKDWYWTGQVRAGRSRTASEVRISEQFPFAPARVFLPDWDTETRWHRERDGGLCLWTDQDRVGLPWLDPKRLRDKMEAWIDADLRGWVGQPPALDLDAYLEASENPRIVLIDGWDQIEGRWLLLRADEDLPTRIGVAEVLQSTAAFKKHHQMTAGVAIDIGEQAKPIGEWRDFAEQMADTLSSDIVQWARIRGEVVILSRYSVDGEPGLLAAAVSLDKNGEPVLHGLTAADATDRELALRGGLRRSDYADKHVVVVGVGAVGSFLVDQLARAGVGKVSIYDPDLLLPGNSIRHLCRAHRFGWAKAFAVKAAIDERSYPGSIEIEANVERLADLRTAVGLLEGSHLVIDATADGAVAQLLLEATRFSNGPTAFLSVAVEGGGQFARVELVPTPQGEKALSIEGVRPVAILISGGCGSPISPTPPSAVLGTAALAARCALALLRNESIGAGRRESLDPIP